MKTWVVFVAAMSMGMLACSVNKQAGGSAGTPDTIKVLSYNIHHANPPSRKDYIDIDAIVAVINREMPDVVALQEVDVYTARSGKSLHQAEAIATKTGMKAYFTKSIDFGGGEYGIAVLSRYPILTGKSHALPTAAGSGGEPRALCTAVLQLPGGRKIMMASTHLDVQRNDSSRLMQIRAINRIIGEAGMPAILAGDFNAPENSATIRTLDSSFTRTCYSCAPTIPVENPKRAIDFIAFRPQGGATVLQHQVIPERYASDHLPVMAVLVIK